MFASPALASGRAHHPPREQTSSLLSKTGFTPRSPAFAVSEGKVASQADERLNLQGVASLRDATRASVSEAPSAMVCG